MKQTKKNGYTGKPNKKSRKLAAKSQEPKVQRRQTYISQVKKKNVSRTRTDVALWKAAQRAAENVENPRRARLYNLYQDIRHCPHLSAQIELLFQHVLSTPFTLKRDGETAEEETQKLRTASWRRKLDRYLLETDLYGHTVVEFEWNLNGRLQVGLFPRNNVIPERGLLLLSEDDDKGIEYRKTREFGTWLLEFGDPDDLGLLNKAVPSVLFMRFAQACWSELCEIYGIPPRILKTNTQDTAMLDRAERMMEEMGSAAWIVIDETEDFEFAARAETKGDVFNNLISVCKEQIALLVNGVMLGMDTAHGNRSKEESSIGLFEKKVDARRVTLEEYWNETILPALVRIGFLPDGLTFEYDQEEDLNTLWTQTHEAMQYYHIDPEWIKEKFGIQVTGEKQSGGDFFNQTLTADQKKVLRRLGAYAGAYENLDKEQREALKEDLHTSFFV